MQSSIERKEQGDDSNTLPRQYILSVTDNAEGFTHHDIGGKARNLFKLIRSKIPVPEFFCIRGEAFSDFIQPHKAEISALLKTINYEQLANISLVSGQIKDILFDSELPQSLEQQIADVFIDYEHWDSFSVRSSATNEDGFQNSFAGQFGTWLNVPPQSIIQHIRLCWASAFEPGVLTYFHKRHIDPLQNNLAVVVQRMVQSAQSGVIFQVDPRGSIQHQVIAAGYGLGEGVVADLVETDLYTYDKNSKNWTLECSEKYSQIVYSDKGGTEKIAIDPVFQSVAVLSDQQRNQLLAASNKISELYQKPQDIEWAFDRSGQLYILQSRPITTVPQGNVRMFDNSNIIESYPGVVSPMTFSIFHLDYYLCIRNALQRLGATASVVEKRDDALRHLVGYINGRAYYNMHNWYRAFLTVPFLEKKIISYFEQMIGTESSYGEPLKDRPITFTEKFKNGIGFPLKVVWNTVRHDSHLAEYFNATSALDKKFHTIDFDNESADELIEKLVNYATEFMCWLGIPILNDFFAMIFMALTREQIKKSGLDNGEALLSDLLANQNIQSTKPVHSIAALADYVRQNEALTLWLQNLDSWREYSQDLNALLATLRTAGFGEFADDFNRHIQDYGHRSPKELIMEADTFRESPGNLVKIIIETAKQPQRTVGIKSIDTKWIKKVKGLRRVFLPWLINKTRKTIAYRESTRLDRGLHFANFRTLLHHIGEKLVAEGAIDHKRDVFLFTLDELDLYRKGCSASPDLKGLAHYRAGLIADWESLDPEQRLFVSGCVYSNKIPNKSAVGCAASGSLYGVGCSSGEITATAKVVRHANDESDVRGKILVTETTDPGWVFLMTIASGLISERGSLLSHTAIIGRELGIPTIVGVKHATKIITDNSTIMMDGKTGKIEII